MPKLDGTHIAGRLRGRLEELREGKEVSARDIRALLTSEQVAAMDLAWTEQQALRKQKRARTKEEEAALGWKTKREIQIESYERALTESDDGMVLTLEELKHKTEVKISRIYLDAYFEAIDAGKPNYVAENIANNDLTRAGFRRLDERKSQFLSKRDREVWEMEQQILGRIRSEMTPEELEQIELWEEHEKALQEKRRKLGW